MYSKVKKKKKKKRTSVNTNLVNKSRKYAKSDFCVAWFRQKSAESCLKILRRVRGFFFSAKNTLADAVRESVRLSV